MADAARGDATLDAALAYAAKGFAVLPLHAVAKGICTCREAGACPSKGKHPATKRGWRDAATDPDTIRGMFQGKRRNLGVACGAPSGGLIVLDVDPRHGGDVLLAKLIEEHGALPRTAVVTSGGGGAHFWFRDPLGLVPRKMVLGPGLDLMSTGNLVVAAPSLHESGNRYKWRVRAPLADLPDWLATCAKKAEPKAVARGGLKVDTVIPLGARNSELTRIAGLLVGRGAGESLVHSVCEQINRDLCDPPMADDELYVLIGSVLKYGPDITKEPFNDIGNARRLVHMHGSRMRWLTTRSTWLIWDGRRWAPDNDEAMRLAKTVPDMMIAEADRGKKVKAEADTDSTDGIDIDTAAKGNKALRDWGRTSGSKGHLEAMLKLAATEPAVAVSEEDLDKHWWLMNTPGGVVDLRSGKMLPHSAELLQTRMATVTPAAGTAPTWVSFLNKVLGGDKELARFIACASGYSLSGSTQEQVLFLMWGEGQNGKTTFLEALRGVMGDYSMNTPFDTFTSKSNDGPRNDIARLAGIRMTLATEGDEGSRLNEAVVKRLTGGDTITARFLFQEFFDYSPRFKIWLATNYRPRIRGSDYAIWRRIRLVPFTVTITAAERDNTLPDKLRAEYPQILWWLIRGAIAWHKSGLPACAKVDLATAQYKQDQDTMGTFLDECCLPGPTEVVGAQELYRCFHRWCLEQGENPWSNKVFKLRLEERGFKRARQATGVSWVGLSLVDGAPDGRLAVVGGRAAR